MRRIRVTAVLSLTALAVGFGSAWAQLVITDPGTTARNAATAVLKSQIVELLSDQYRRLEQMAERLTTLEEYASDSPPAWERRGEGLVYAGGYWGALNRGDADGAQYGGVARTRQRADLRGADVPVTARDAIRRALATLDIADSTIITGTHTAGQLRQHGRDELAAIDQLERHVVDSSATQSATAVLDKISGAILIEARQKQARIEYLMAIAEQLLVDNKRARDAEAAVMNMQLGRLRTTDTEGDDRLLSGAGDDLRTWRQP